jgi:2-dehydropantoate 2-reductase
MELVIWGAGAIGGTLGAYLVRAGHDVIFVDTVAEHVDALNTTGLTITGPIDEFTIPVTAYTPDTLPGQYDIIVLCTKAQHTREATEALKPYLSADGYVVSAQNGLNELAIQEIVGQERTVGSFVNFGADYLEPGVIHFGGRGAVVLGEMDGSTTPRIEALYKTFLDFDDQSVITDNIWGYLWGKEAYGAMLFITALTNEAIADALADLHYRELYVTIASEILQVAQKLGIQIKPFNGFDPPAYLPGADPEASSRSMDALVAFNRKSAKTHSGIWRDLAVRKRRTEVSEYGIIVEEAERVGVPVPLTRQMMAMIHEIEEGKRPQSLANLDKLKASLK